MSSNKNTLDTSYLINILNVIFPILIKDDMNLLLDGIDKVINLIKIKFNFSNREDILWKQLKQNNDRDIKAIVQMLLPFVNDTKEDATKKLKNLSTLNDLYTKKIDGDYYYTNSQYNRAVIIDDTNIIERPYTRDYFQHHLQLLLMSIEMSSNKLYVNWTDVVPITMDQYSNNSLYKLTVDKLSKKILPEFLNGYIDMTNGLSTADIYNTISNLLFNQIKNEKWLIYDLFIEKSTVPYIKYLDKVLDLRNIHNKVSWSHLFEQDRLKFKSMWESFLNSNDRSDNTITVDFYFFFKKYYKKASKLLADGLLKETNSTIEMEDDRCDPFSKKIITEAKQGIQFVPIEDIYAFFYDQINLLKRTWYYYLLYKKNVNIIGSFVVDNITVNITPKNIYNFSKSLTYDLIGDSYTELPRLFNTVPNDSLLEKIKHRIYNVEHRIYNDYTWFNINCYYKRLYPDLPTYNYPNINKTMYEKIQASLAEIIFETMIYAGYLSEVNPNSNITDKNSISKIIGNDDRAIINYQRNQMKKTHFTTNRIKYENFAYYYLTGLTYGELPEIVNENYTKKYFDFITDETIWQFTYAMDWISQINFYHHYANNRVSYVTGSTGVGKSTQVPKLLLYAQRILDHNTKGKIVCTQPRISPTTGNAKAISREMGVPIVEYSNVFKKEIHTSNYFIQYKHSEYNHVDNEITSFLRIVTDGTLLSEINRNPYLCRSSKSNDILINNKAPDFIRKYDSGNIYDIVIVDEAHEHNANMDVILTLMRDAAYVNNSLRLIIVSATMDDDEPIYRRYYRFINDNKLYPLSSYIKENIFDRANMDRRIHISPPGSTTQFKIDEIPPSKIDAMTLNENNYLKAGIDKTIFVVNKTTSGDLLLFMAGKSDIIESVIEINKRTPSNVICLPFYSEMSEEDKLFTENIATTLPNYIRYKEDVLLDKSVVNRSVPKNTYKRSIIVATNVAEASITLPKLRYVIDTGYAKVNTFDPISGTNRLVTLPISQSSSLQRKGRVGRVASGEFYYLYDKEKIAKNKTMYKIADSDPSDLIISLISKTVNDIIFTQSDFNDIGKLKLSFTYSLIENIIKKQYNLINGMEKYFYNYYGRDSGTFEIEQAKYFDVTHEEHINIDRTFISILGGKAITGLAELSIFDGRGRYFIIHPDENIVHRHPITGIFMSLKTSPSINPSYYYYMIKQNKIDTMLGIDLNLDKKIDQKIKLTSKVLLSKVISVKILRSIEKLLRLDIIESTPVPFFTEENKRSTKGEVIYRNKNYTHLSQSYSLIHSLGSTLNIDILNNFSNLIWFLHGVANKIDMDVIAVLTMMTVAVSPKKFSDKKYGEKFRILHRNKYGDIYFYFNLWSRLKSISQIKDIFEQNDLTNLVNKFPEKKSQFINKSMTNIDDYLIFKKLYDRNKLNTSDEIYYYIETYTPDVNITSDITAILKNFASSNYLSYDILMDFFKKMILVNLNIAKKKFMSTYATKESDRDFLILETVKNNFIFPKIFNDYTTHNKYNNWYTFLDSYLSVYFTNGLIRSKQSYYSFNALDVNDNIYIDADNTLDSIYPYVVYHTFDMTNDNTVSIITAINIEYIIKANPQYFSKLENNNKIKKYLKQFDMDNYNSAMGKFKNKVLELLE